MSETPVDVLERWAEHGAQWRVRSVGETRAVVELRECTGELVELLESDDPELLEYLRDRPASA